MKPYTRSSTFVLLSLCGIPGLVEAQLHLPFSRQVRDLSNTIVRRDSNPSLSLWASDYVYIVNATVGTPGQSVALVVSPSTPHTWIPDATSSSCNYSESHGYYTQDGGYQYNYTYSSYCLWGSFDKSASSTYQSNNTEYDSWSAYTPDGNYIDGYQFTDTLKVGDVTVENLAMGLAEFSTQWIGALGLGYNVSWDEYSWNGGFSGNFLDRLVQAGTIATKAYSIWLDAEDGSSGSLLMGAVDTSRFQGTLTRMRNSGYISVQYGDLGVTVNSINGSSSNSSSAVVEAFPASQFPFSASISTGETFSILADPVAANIWSMAGATYNSTISLATIPCDAATTAEDGGAHFTVELGGEGGPLLEVSLADLIIPQTVAAQRWGSGSPIGAAPPNTCFFAVQNQSMWNDDVSDDQYGSSPITYSDSYTVGAALLRRSYMVFDVLNGEVAIAPAKLGSTATSNVVAFESYGAVAPSSACLYSAAGNLCSSSGSSTSGSASPDPAGSDSGSHGTINVGLTVGISIELGLISLVGLVASFVVWRKMLRNKPVKEIESDAAQGGADSSVATDQLRIAQGPPAAAQEMTQNSRDQAP